MRSSSSPGRRAITFESVNPATCRPNVSRSDPHLLPLVEPRQDAIAVGLRDVETRLREHQVEARKRKRRAVLRRDEDRRLSLALLTDREARELEHARDRRHDAVPPDRSLDRPAACQGEGHRRGVEFLVHRRRKGDFRHPVVLPAEVAERLHADVEPHPPEQFGEVVRGSVGGLAPTEPRADALRELADDAEDEFLVEPRAHHAVPLKSAANGSQ